MNDTVFLILTRLFLINKEFSQYAPITPEWVEGKWDTFVNQCLPSVTTQTNKEFDFVVLVDKSFPFYDLVKGKVQRENKRGTIKLNYVDFTWGDGVPFGHKPRTFIKDISKFVYDYVLNNYSNCKKLITARLDGDDLISRDYVEMAYNNITDGWLSFENGYYWYVTNDLVDNIIKITDFQNAHLIYTESFTKEVMPLTVYHRMHNKIGFKKGDSQLTVVANDVRGWWIDGVGQNSNIKKNSEYMKYSRGWESRVLEEKSKAEIKQHFELPECIKNL